MVAAEVVGLPWVLTGVTLIVWAQQVLGFSTQYTWVAPVMVALGGAGVALLLAGLTRRGRDLLDGDVAFWLIFGLVAAAFGTWAYLIVGSSPGYGTDEIAFDQYAAHLLTHGLNPYSHSMAPAFSAFHVSPDGYTFNLNGTPVTRLSYPALSFLLYVPLLLAGLSTQLAVVVNVAAWVVTLALVSWFVPRASRPLVLVLGSLSVYIAYSVGGVTDLLYMPFLAGAAVAWHRFGEGRRWSWLSPVLFGAAASVKQTPWLVLPFVLVGLALRGRARGRPGWWRPAGGYLAIVATTFAMVNLPFVVMGPRAWWGGVLTPLSAHTVPAGQGVVGLSLFMGLGGGSLVAYTVTAGLVLAGLLVVYTLGFPALEDWTYLMPTPVLFFAGRSFGSYLVSLVPPALVAVASRRRASGEDTASDEQAPALRAARRWPVAVAGLAAVSALLFALAARPPLGLTIQGVTTTGQLATVVKIDLSVANRSGRDERPYFSVESGSILTSFWLSRGPSRLAPHSRAHYEILAPNFFAQPGIGGGFQVAAFTEAPGSVSVSPPYRPTRFHLALVPNAINRPVQVGQVVHVTAEVLDQLDRAVPVAGVPVYLGQVVYAQAGLEFGQAEINGASAGQTPISALTDSSGQAHFQIVGTVAGGDPTYFEANLVDGSAYYPYGYSEILPIRFQP